MAGNVKLISSKDFDSEVKQATTPVVVDFWADWCGPCKAIAPVIEELSNNYDGKVKFCKINVDDNPDKANEYSVRAIPTLLIFKDGKVASNLVGFKTKAELASALDKTLA